MGIFTLDSIDSHEVFFEIQPVVAMQARMAKYDGSKLSQMKRQMDGQTNCQLYAPPSGRITSYAHSVPIRFNSACWVIFHALLVTC